MIDELQITGLGVIERARLEMPAGMTVLTGETGVGKTMILASLRLLLGEKASTSLVRQGHDRLLAEAVFSLDPAQQDAARALAPDDVGPELIVSRSLPREGRGRVRVNEHAVTLKSLAALCGPLVTIHGQADQWSLRDGGAARELLDAFAGEPLAELAAEYREAWREAVRLKRNLDQLREDYDHQQVEIQYLQEITAAVADLGVRPDEDDALAAEIDRLANGASLREAATEAAGRLVGSDTVGGALDAIGAGEGLLQRVAAADPQVAALRERLAGIAADLSELAADLRSYADDLSADPARLEELQQRRASFEDLLRGRATDAAELLEWAAGAADRLRVLRGEENDPDRAADLLADAQRRVLELARQIQGERQRAGTELAERVTRELAGLAMPGATLRVALTETKPGPTGIDLVEFQLSSRKAAPFVPLGEGASGGELSRIMLAIEVTLGDRESPRTFVFDEVDAGIGGRTATQVGARLAKLAQQHQIIVVTHLPQVAALADHHVVLEKEGEATRARAVTGEERVGEIVRMLGGEADSEAAHRHARELLAAHPGTIA